MRATPRGAGTPAGHAPERRLRAAGTGRAAPGDAVSAAAPPTPAIGIAAARFREVMEDAPVDAFIKDAAGRYIYVNRHLLETRRSRFGTGWYGKTDFDLWPRDVAERNRASDRITLSGVQLPVFTQVMPHDDGPHDFLVTKFAMPGEDGEAVLGGVGIDLTQHARTSSERDRLATAIEQADESVEITDLEGRITYVNPAFERSTGYRRDEVIGQNPRILKSGAQSKTFYDAMWAMLANGLPWASDIVNRRKDGTLFTESSVISPIRDTRGAVTAYVAVKHDVTSERKLEKRSAALIRERALIADTIRGIRAGDSPEATAQAICHQVVSLTGITAAQLYLFELDGRAVPIGFVVAGLADPELRRLPHQRSRHLRERAGEGPWIEPWLNRPWHPYNRLLNSLGVHSAAYAPVRFEDRLIGLLVVDADTSGDESSLAEQLPALVEFADLVGALIGRDVIGRTETRRARDMIGGIIERQAFRPVFQPVVDLVSGVVAGYEALTRFEDGVAPDVRFGEAAQVGLGLELEMATLRAALIEAEHLPRHAWLALNVSPSLLVAGGQLRRLLRPGRRRLVVEVTEHTAIADYPAFKAAVAQLGPRVQLAVDDAGAGFASLRHILELSPAIVKLDRSLVADLDSDTARQAMIVGMRHFARETGARIVAEGIETQAELEILRALGIELGQGYLLGRPGPVLRPIEALLPASPAGRPAARRATPRIGGSPARSTGPAEPLLRLGPSSAGLPRPSSPRRP